MITFYKKIYDGIDAAVSCFENGRGNPEYHMMLSSRGSGSFESRFDSIVSAYAAARNEFAGNASPVFMRFFLSDVYNQASYVEEYLKRNEQCAVSVIGQPPLDGSKVALWAVLQSGVEVRKERCGLWVSDNGEYRHLWSAGNFVEGGDSEFQMTELIDSYAMHLESVGCSLPGNCIRTWIFVDDVDNNYAGIVKGRRERFEQMNLLPDTHYVASTGIEGRNSGKNSNVTLDTYAVEGLEESQIRYLNGSTHLNPTHEYGVTFERGTVVDYGDRRQVIISGTASIDNKGGIVHPGDVGLQTHRMMENVEVLLNEAGCTYDDVMHMIVYLRDISDYDKVKAIYDERFPKHPKVFVWAPVCRPGWLVEMECMAMK